MCVCVRKEELELKPTTALSSALGRGARLRQRARRAGAGAEGADAGGRAPGLGGRGNQPAKQGWRGVGPRKLGARRGGRTS